MCAAPAVELYSLVDAGVVPPLAREAKHAADDSAVELAPPAVADLLPLAAILHLHVALGHRDALAIRGQDGTDADVLHLDIEVLERKPDRKTVPRVAFSAANLDFVSDLTGKQFTAVNCQITGLVCLLIWHPESMKRHVLPLQPDDVSSHTRALLPVIHNIHPPPTPPHPDPSRLQPAAPPRVPPVNPPQAALTFSRPVTLLTLNTSTGCRRFSNGNTCYTAEGWGSEKSAL